VSEIAILVPVLGRPQRVEPLLDSIDRATTIPHRVVFIASDDDVHEIDALYKTGRGDILMLLLDGPEPGDYARKINTGYRETSEPWLFQASDDLLFHPGWDTAALAVAKRTDKGVIGTNDLGNPLTMRGRHATHSLIARWYADEHGTIDRKGEILHEGYHHCWVDNELVQTAWHRHQFAFARDSHVEHLHPIWHKGEDDDTYRRGQEHYRDDQLYFNRNRRPLWAKGGRRR
jgi:glycosyltransferase involved in cell wall biosynthesis